MVQKKTTKRPNPSSGGPRQSLADLASRLARMERIGADNARRLRIQFQRLAQLQADLDSLKERLGSLTVKAPEGGK